MSPESKKPHSGWTRLAAGVAVIVAVVLTTVWYKQYSAEKTARELVPARAVPAVEKQNARPKPSPNVAGRPTRDRGPRP